MYGYILQDWVTIRGNSSITNITQGETGWLGLAPFQDIVVWLDTREVTLGGATHLQIQFETAPTKDDSLFQAMATAVNLDANVGTVNITKIIMAQNPTVPLGRWVRWKILVSGAASSAWDATFRVLACCNNVGAVVNG
jgi:hypothetical protein